MKTFYFYDWHKKNNIDDPTYELVLDEKGNIKTYDDPYNVLFMDKATDLVPPTYDENEIPIFNIKENKWEVVSDFRKKTIWYLSEVLDKEEVIGTIWNDIEIQKLGDPEKELEKKGISFLEISITKPEPTIFMDKEAKLSELNKAYQKTFSGFYNINKNDQIYKISLDEEEFSNFKHALEFQEAKKGTDEILGIATFCKSNSLKDSDIYYNKGNYETLRLVLNEVNNVKTNNYQHFTDLKQELIAAKSISEIKHIDTSTGWITGE